MGAVQVLGRRAKPRPWAVRRDLVARHCQWSHEGLVVALPVWDTPTDPASQSWRDPITRSPGAGSAPIGWGANGIVAALRTGTSDIHGVRRADLPTGANASVVLAYRRRDTTNRQSGGFGYESSTSVAAQRFGAHMPFNDGTLYFDYGGNTAGVTRLTVSGITWGDDVWVFTVGSRGMEIWQNGIRRASNAATPTRTANTTNVWGAGGHGGFGADNADVGCLLCYDHQLSESAIQSLTLDPWTPFRPSRRAISLALAGGGGALSRSFVPAFIG